MRDYVDQLETQLMRIARTEGRARAPRRRPAVGKPRRWSVLVGVGVAASAAAVIGLSLGSAPDRALAFPVMSRPAVDAATSLGILPQLTRAGADPQQARPIPTAHGTGYVMPTDAGGMCLAWPDPEGGYGTTCGTSAQLASRGLPAALVPPDPSNARPGTKAAIAEFLVVLPAGAGAPIAHHADGRTEALALHDGVASTLVRDDVTITYEVDGTAQAFRVPAHAPAMTPTPGAVARP